MRGNVLRLQHVIEIFTEECCSCGVLFGMTQEFKKERLQDHRNFYCPNGHHQHYTAETDAEKNARLLREEQARHQRTLQRENEIRIAKEKAERKLRRVDRGVCPECKRTFPNLARHMACKHNQSVPIFGKRKLP